MAWYRAGTVTVTNGSPVVTGAGTDFVSNTQAGEAFQGPDGRSYEIASVESATQLTLQSTYQGATANGQGYAIQPTSSFARDLALQAATLLNSFAAVRDGIGQGLIPDGTVAAPGLRFSADQDTGLRSVSANAMAIVAGGADRLTISAAGATVVGRVTSAQADAVGIAAPALGTLPAGSSAFFSNSLAYGLLLGTNGTNGSSWVQSQRVDGTATAYDMMLQPSGGNLLVGTTSGNAHHIGKLVGQGDEVLGVSNAGYGFITARFYSVGSTNLGSSTGCALAVGTNPTTGRSVNAGGTINASGADYAEYMTKADGCGTIAAGEVCGVDNDGHLTKTWADAISFVVKSTNPSYVGGDTWAAPVGQPPEKPGVEPNQPAGPGNAPDAPTDSPEYAAWQAATDAYPAALKKYQDDHAAWQAASTQYASDRAAWDAALEAARQKVDRIAFSGQVPVNVAGAANVGDYLIAQANGGGIQAVAVPAAEMTFEQYRLRIGKVWAIRDGRPWVDVQHG